MAPNPLSLKQRLAALSANIPGNSSDTPPQSPTSKRRPFFSPPIGKRQPGSFVQGDSQGLERIHDVMGRVIFQAGVDYETRPMVVMNASALPDPREVSYDLLLERILAYLNLFVESDYTVVFFAAGGRHTPGWNWVWKAYKSLSRKYRKNLKKLFIVHSNFFTKMLFSLAGSIISPKFFRKITYINTLSDLAYHVPLTQIDIPPAVYQENLKHEKQITLPTPSRADLFGVPLEELMGFDGEKGGVPRVVKDCTQYLRQTGLEDEGIFRRSPNSVLLKQVQQAYDRGQVVSLETFGDPHLAAVLLKKFLRDLPTPIFPETLYPMVLRCPPATDDPTDMASITYIRETLLPELPHCAYILLSHYMQLLHEVSLRSDVNKMDARNLAVVISPNLVSGSNPIRDVMMCAVPSDSAPFVPSPPFPQQGQGEGRTTLGAVVKLCIHRYYEVFDEVHDRSEPLPQRPFQARPASPSSTSSPRAGRNRDSTYTDDEDIDDAMLVMPIGPSSSGGHTEAPQPPAVWPPTAWNVGAQPSANGGGYGYKVRERAAQLERRSVHTAFGAESAGGVPSAWGTVKARSTISIEKGNPSRKGSISVGRGTRKGSGAGVEAVGITAAGFFAAPESAPPVPSRPGRYT
ncbi:Rho GTPase activation protein [Amylocystis lapponica]|nr:Rho GTPase activation protein [Amylocystis lapponica]